MVRHDAVSLSGKQFVLHRLLAIAVLLTCDIYSYPGFITNDVFMFFSWTRKESDTLNYGYNLFTRINSQVIKNNSMLVNAAVRVAGLPEWMNYVSNHYGSMDIAFTNTKPSNIVNCSSSYESCPWLNHFRLTLDNEIDTIRFLFPIPDQNTAYHKYDHFTISVNDSVNLQFQGVDDSTFMGSLLNNNRRNEPNKWLMEKGAVMVRTSNRAPFRIRDIELKAAYKDLMSSYLGFDLSRLSKDCDYYGMDFIDTTIAEVIISTSGLKIQDAKTLNVDSAYTLTWSTKGKESIKACSLYVKFNNDPQWIPIGHTAGNIDKYIWLVPDNGKTSCAFMIKAIGYEGQNSSDTSNVYTIAGNSIFQLEATAISNSAAQIKWTSLFDTTTISHIVIAYSTDRAALVYNGSDADTVKQNLYVNLDTIYNLQTEALYYFAAYKVTIDNRFISAGPLSFDSIRILDKTPPVNNFRLTYSVDSSKIKLVWKSIGEIPADVDNVGIFMCRFRYPVSIDDTESDSVLVLPAADSNFSIKNLKSGAYYFALMVSDSFGNWSGTTDNSITRVFLDNGSSEILKIAPSDTQHLFSDSLSIWSTSNTTFTDTIDRWEGPAVGFISISQGFLFRNGDKLNSIFVQVPYSVSIKPDDAVKIRLYSYDIYNDGWMLNQSSIKVDTVKYTIQSENTYPSYPFMFMIDTLPPVINLMSNLSTPVTTSQRLNDTLSVKDNIKNYDLKFIGGPGAVLPWDLSLYIKPVDTLKNLQILNLRIPPGIADSRTGLRSSFTVSDNVSTVSINLSRPVIRDTNVDNFTTEQNQWMPVIISAPPDHPELKSIMKNSNNSDNWTYNTKELRIIKWVPRHSKAFNLNWVEYSTEEDSLFKAKPGFFYWIKTKNSMKIDFGSAIVPQLIDTPAIKILPKQWLDFANPFPFDIYIGDILQASGYINTTKPSNPLLIYRWENTGKLYRVKETYLQSVAGFYDIHDTIKSKEPYSIYNDGDDAFFLRIPPVCAPVSSILKDKEVLTKRKQSSSKQWSIRIDSWVSDNSSLPSVFCGYNAGLPRNITYPKPPTFSQQNVSIYDSQKRVTWGCIISSQKSENGNYFEFITENNASTLATIHTAIGKTFNLDQSLMMKWFDPEHDIWTDAHDTLKVSLDPKQNQVRILALGNDRYFRDLGSILRKNVLALRAVYPNPFKRYLKVQFSLPYKTEQVTFYIYNLIGQVLWRKDLNNPQPGPSNLKMDMKLATGMYVFQMRVKVEGSGSQKVLNRVVMCTK